MTEDRVPHPECIKAYHGRLLLTGRTIMSVARVRGLVAAAVQPAPPLRPRFCVSCEGQHDEMKHALEQDRVLDVERLTTVLIEAEADDMLGSEYMPSKLAKYIAARLGPAPSRSEPTDENVELLRRLDDWTDGQNAGPLIRWAAAHLRGCVAAPSRSEPEDDPISDSRQPEDGPPPGRWPR